MTFIRVRVCIMSITFGLLFEEKVILKSLVYIYSLRRYVFINHSHLNLVLISTDRKIGKGGGIGYECW